MYASKNSKSLRLLLQRNLVTYINYKSVMHAYARGPEKKIAISRQLCKIFQDKIVSSRHLENIPDHFCDSIIVVSRHRDSASPRAALSITRYTHTPYVRSDNVLSGRLRKDGLRSRDTSRARDKHVMRGARCGAP